jgi:hypothetical protein
VLVVGEELVGGVRDHLEPSQLAGDRGDDLFAEVNWHERVVLAAHARPQRWNAERMLRARTAFPRWTGMPSSSSVVRSSE